MSIEIGRIYLSEKYDCFFYLDWGEMTIYIKNDKIVREYTIDYSNFVNIFEENCDFDKFDRFNNSEMAIVIEDNLEYFLTNIIKIVKGYGSLQKTIIYNIDYKLFSIFSDLLYYELSDNNYYWVN